MYNIPSPDRAAELSAAILLGKSEAWRKGMLSEIHALLLALGAFVAQVDDHLALIRRHYTRLSQLGTGRA
jgi:hypothetical protein